MISKVIYEVIFLLCCSVCVASVHGPGNIFLGNQTGWNLAWKVCHDNQTRLPNVKVSKSGLELVDRFHWEPDECFWIGATYELITNYTYGTFPTVCCGTVTKKNNVYVRSCDNCEGTQQFVCESGSNEVSDVKLKNTYLPWINASKECADRRLLLPSVNSTNFLGRVTTSLWWINEARILNLSPIPEICSHVSTMEHSVEVPSTPPGAYNLLISSECTTKNGDVPICFCAAASLDSQCSYHVKTYCIPDTRSNISTTVTRKLSMLSTDTCSTIPITTVTTINGESLTEKSNATEISITRFQSVTRTTTVNTETTGNGALVGSLIGTTVAVIVIITIGVIVIVRRKRIKKRATDNIHYETPMNARPKKKVQPQANSSYGIVFDGTLDLDKTSTSLPRIQTVPREPVLNMQPQSIKQISINNNDDNKSVDNKEPPLYSMVQKGQRKNDTTDEIEEGYINDKEYNKIEFDKRYVSESSGDMYDKARMPCLESYKELDANVDNMNDVCCTKFDKNECSENVKENCSQIENLYDNAIQEENGAY